MDTPEEEEIYYKKYLKYKEKYLKKLQYSYDLHIF